MNIFDESFIQEYILFSECCSKLHITVSSEDGIDNETSGEYLLRNEKVRGRPVYRQNGPEKMVLFYHENEWIMGRDPNSNREKDILMKVEGEAYACPETENNEENYNIATETSNYEVNVKCIGKHQVSCQNNYCSMLI